MLALLIVIPSFSHVNYLAYRAWEKNKEEKKLDILPSFFKISYHL